MSAARPSRPARLPAIETTGPGLPRWISLVLHDVDEEDFPADLTPAERLRIELPRKEALATAWALHGGAVTEKWAREAPGTRPTFWWSYSAPRQPLGRYSGCYYDGQLCEPRLRVGGKGLPAHECLGYVPVYEYGLPTRWISDSTIACYERMGTPLRVPRFDPARPPIFESQPAYLRRFGLLLRGEASRLSARDYRAVALPEEYWPDASEPAPR